MSKLNDSRGYPKRSKLLDKLPDLNGLEDGRGLPERVQQSIGWFVNENE